MTTAAIQAKRRKNALAEIHVARQQLGIDEEAYRAIIRRVSAEHGPEVASSAKLDDKQRQAVVNEFRRLRGGQPGRGSFPGKPHNFGSSAMPELITKIEAQLADMKLSWAYADAIGKRQFGVAKVAWIRDEVKLKAIVAALHVEQSKRAGNEFIDQAIKRLGMTAKQLAELTGHLPKNWRRQVQVLDQVCKHLGARVEMLDQKEAADRGHM